MWREGAVASSLSTARWIWRGTRQAGRASPAQSSVGALKTVIKMFEATEARASLPHLTQPRGATAIETRLLPCARVGGIRPRRDVRRDRERGPLSSQDDSGDGDWGRLDLCRLRLRPRSERRAPPRGYERENPRAFPAPARLCGVCGVVNSMPSRPASSPHRGAKPPKSARADASR